MNHACAKSEPSVALTHHLKLSIVSEVGISSVSGTVPPKDQLEEFQRNQAGRSVSKLQSINVTSPSFDLKVSDSIAIQFSCPSTNCILGISLTTAIPPQVYSEGIVPSVHSRQMLLSEVQTLQSSTWQSVELSSTERQ